MGRKGFETLGIILLAGAALVAVFAPAQGEDFRKEGASSAVAEPDKIVITLPFERRLAEAIDEEGHQPWRRDLRFSAMVELEALTCVEDSDEVIEEYRVVKEGIDARGRLTAVVEKDLPDGFWRFQKGRAAIELFQNEGEVWIATKIVIRELPDPPEGR